MRGFLAQKLMKIVDYVKETRGELKHVSWPTRAQAVNYTVVIILISIVVALLLGFSDYIFSNLLRMII